MSNARKSCQQPFNAYRRQAAIGFRPLCGDCAGDVNRTPIDARIAETKTPEVEHKGAWMTPCWDGDF